MSKELEKAVSGYESYINNHGISEEVINAYVQAAQVALKSEKDIEYGLKISSRAKELIESLVVKLTGGTIEDLEVFCGENQKEYQILNQYYNALECEAPYLVDSFFYYIELDEKDPYKRFYFPRRKVLQPVVSAYQEVYDGKLDFLSVSQPKRTGKCVEENTLVCTPFGFRPIKDINVGDFIISANGNRTRVLGVYPQETELEVYEIEFTESGKSRQKTIIECCKNHLWEVSTEDSRYKKRPNRIMNTLEIFNGTIKRGKDKHNNYAVRYVNPVEFEKREISINPWLLGVLLGDGTLCGENIKFSNTENDIVKRVEDIAIKDHKTKLCSVGNGKDYRLSYGNLREELSVLGLIGTRSETKFIPKTYLYNSVEVREKLLQGLCDTDGYTEKGGIEYCTVSEKLAEDIQFLVKSLGGKISCEIKNGHYTKNNEKIETKDYYRLYINFPNGKISPVSSKKHLKKYSPSRETLYHFINDVRKTNRKAKMICLEVEDVSHLYVVSENFIPTHNTTGGLRLAQMMGGRDPDGSVFAVGKGEGLVKRFYGGLLQAFETKQIYERFIRVFPEAVKIGEKDYKSAENLSIDLKSKNTFPTYTCRPIDGAIVGCTEANLLVYIDDCVKNHEEARNRDRLEFLCEKVTDDVLGRRLEGTPIIIQGTKYSLYDPITALQNKAVELGWKWKEVAIPALDPKTDESNWEIVRKDKKGVRKIFTTDYYRKERMLVSEETWAAEFQQEPFEAKGRMFPKGELNRFIELPVDKEPDAIMAACDTADNGTDYCSMPVAYIYGHDVFIVDVVFDNSGTKHTKPECANMLVKHNVKTVVFESNSAGRYFGRDVMNLVKEQGGRCSDRYKFNCANKITRMENARDNIMRDYWFLDESKYERNSQYYLFMKNLTEMTRSGKVPHDDAPDSLSLLENEMRKAPKPTIIMPSPI